MTPSLPPNVAPAMHRMLVSGMLGRVQVQARLSHGDAARILDDIRRATPAQLRAIVADFDVALPEGNPLRRDVAALAKTLRGGT